MRVQMPLALRISKDFCLGWGTVALALALACAGAFELMTGHFMPGGYRDDVQWLGSSLLLHWFRAFGPYVSGVIWLALASGCMRIALRILAPSRSSKRKSRQARSR
jgi:hypothetical protein